MARKWGGRKIQAPNCAARGGRAASRSLALLANELTGGLFVGA
jgi:hypothetical protein